jgi:nucleotide-binding universal stress UspA family protein
MLRKILVALDGSANAEKSLPWVKRYAAREKAEVTLIRVANLEEFGRDHVHVELRYAADYLTGVEAKLKDAGISCKIVARVGDPARVIVRTAESEGCDLILMTTRGGSRVKRWVIGGVTENVLRLSPIPVLAIRNRKGLPGKGQVRRIIVPVDGSKLAESSLPWTVRLAKFLKARIVFLHVYPAGPIGLRTRHQRKFENLGTHMGMICAELAKQGVRAAFNVQSGDPADRILAFATPNDLVVATTHGSGGFRRWIFGSVAEKLIHDGEIPVLVYKGKAQGIALDAQGTSAKPA